MTKMEQTESTRASLDAYSKSIERFREYYREEVIGRFNQPLLAANPRFRKTHDAATWTGYEVMLDVFPDVFAYGILCVPKDLPAGEKRPVVVCQHGLEGRPQDIVTGDHPAYHDFASKLAERGFITFAPQNLYIGHDRFRTLQRKSYLLKKTLVLSYRAAASADRELVGDASICGRQANWFLWLVVWWQECHAHSTLGARVLFVDLFG